jgi:hypothetical protein
MAGGNPARLIMAAMVGVIPAPAMMETVGVAKAGIIATAMTKMTIDSSSASCPVKPSPRSQALLGKKVEMESSVLPDFVKTAAILAAILMSSLPLYGCYTPGQRALGGGIIGGLGGAGIGALASGGLAGPTLAAGAIGAASGALIGAATAPTPRYYAARRYARRHYY